MYLATKYLTHDYPFHVIAYPGLLHYTKTSVSYNLFNMTRKQNYALFQHCSPRGDKKTETSPERELRLPSRPLRGSTAGARLAQRPLAEDVRVLHVVRYRVRNRIIRSRVPLHSWSSAAPFYPQRGDPQDTAAGTILFPPQRLCRTQQRDIRSAPFADRRGGHLEGAADYSLPAATGWPAAHRIEVVKAGDQCGKFAFACLV